MKIRQAKKILGYNEHSHINKHQKAHFMKLRPPIINANGDKIYPSWSDIDVIRRANIRFRKYIKIKNHETK